MARNLQRDLAEHGVRVGVCRIKRIRQKLACCKQKRRFKTTTNSARLPADNLLGQQFKVSQPNAVWVSDTSEKNRGSSGELATRLVAVLSVSRPRLGECSPELVAQELSGDIPRRSSLGHRSLGDLDRDLGDFMRSSPMWKDQDEL